MTSCRHLSTAYSPTVCFLAITPVSLNHTSFCTSSAHRCTGVSCCGCSRCRLAGRPWSSVLWRRAGSRRCRSRSPVCRRSNQQRAHLRSTAPWARRTTQLQTARGPSLARVYARQKTHREAWWVQAHVALTFRALQGQISVAAAHHPSQVLPAICFTF